jgi:DHA1 family multidrug resistance protein-like MFS transporter
MLLRAYFGAAIVLSLMGTVTHPVWLIGLRLMQGALTGTVSAAQTLVSVNTPSHRSGFALGTLNSAVFSGSLTGAFLGGWAAEVFGYRKAFYFSGIVMLISAGLVFFGVREYMPNRTKEKIKNIFAGLHPGKEQLKVALPILLLMSSVMFVRQFDTSFVPLLVQRIHGGLEGAAFISGTLFAVCGIAGVLSGIILGWLSDRVSPGNIGKWSALAAGLLILPQGFTTCLGFLFIERFGMVFASGGLEPVMQIWLCKMTPEKSRGLIFGWAASARALGWFFAPLLSGAIASIFGLSYVFFCGSICYIILFVLIVRTVKKLNKPETQPSDAEIESPSIVPDR